MVGVVFTKDFPTGTLTDLRHVAEVGQVPEEEEQGHRDGWGIVSFRSGSPRYIGRSPRSMHLDPSFDSALEDVVKIETPNILIAHARAASAGGASIPNTHPFIVEGTVLGHNGTIKDFHPRTKRSPKGETDSERLALLLGDRMDELGALKTALKSVILDDLSSEESTALVLLASDGERLYGYRDYAREDRADYYDLRIAKCEGYVALFQESFMGYCGRISHVKKGELVSVDLDLTIKREMLL
jgi:predicted glutamine amidotransferase